MRFDGHASFVLLFDEFLELFADHIRYVFNVTTSLRCGDAVDERNLLKALVRRRHSDLPSVVYRFKDGFQLAAFIILTTL